MRDNLVLIFFFFVLLFLFAWFGPGFSFSVINSNRTDFFTVSATGKVTAVPDVAEVTVGFTSTGSSVSQVQSQANLVIKNVTNSVKNLGVGEQDLQTTNYNLRQDYDKKGNFVIDVNLLIRCRQLDKVNSVIDAATANGANQIGSLNFTFADPEKIQSQARKIAIDNAKKKAAEIAGESGITLGHLINVSENSSDYPRPMLMTGAVAEKAATPTSVEPGSSEITSTVTLSYETR